LTHTVDLCCKGGGE